MNWSWDAQSRSSQPAPQTMRSVGDPLRLSCGGRGGCEPGSRRDDEEYQPHSDGDENRKRAQRPRELTRQRHYQEPGSLQSRWVVPPEEPGGEHEDGEVLEMPVR